jgi:hypothetical protein
MLPHPWRQRRSAASNRRPAPFRPWLEALEDRTAPATFFVTNLGDSNVLGSGSLRDAINQSNSAGGTNVIQFTGAAASGTILLNGGNFGLPTIMNNLTIQGPGASTLTVQRPTADPQQFGIFTVGAGVVSTISGLTITGGDATSAPMGGGGINNYGTLTVNDCVITGNQTTVTGGGINNQNKLYVNRCTISNNQAYSSGAFTGYGGGIQNVYDVAQDRLLVITDSTLSNNTANSVGGGIDNQGTVIATRCTFNGNVVQVSNGGALENRTKAVMTVVDSTVFGNSANGKGGGVRNLGTLTLTNSTVSGNTAVTTDGGGISQYPLANGSKITLNNTIVAGNTAPLGPDIQANGVNPVTANYSFIGTLAGATIVSNHVLTGNPMLGPLQNNGGLTQTMALLPGSPAIDAGSNALASGLSTDQRGFNRIVNSIVDIGAYEFQPPGTAMVVVSSLNPSVFGQGVTFTATVSATAPGSNPLQGTVTFLDNGTPLGTVQLVNGTASFSTTTLLPGSHTITVQYSGFTQTGLSFSASMGALVQTVRQPGPPGIIVVGADAGTLPEVKVFDAQTGALKFDFFPFPLSFRGGVRVAVGDVNGDGVPDIVVGAGPGGGPQVRVYDGKTGQPLAGILGSFFGITPSSFTGGVFVAVGDVNGDGFGDVIVGADAGGGPQVDVFSGKDGSLLAVFNAFAPTFAGGVRVAAGDVNGDGKADIITGAGTGGGPQVRVFSGADLTVLQNYYAFPATFTGGVFVAAGDINGDGRADVIVGAGPGGLPQVSIFSDASNGTVLASFLDPRLAALPQTLGVVPAGVRVSTATVNGKLQIETASGIGSPAIVDNYDAATLTFLDTFFAFPAFYMGGIFIG